MNCGHEGCERPATHAPKLCIPAIGHPARYKEALKMMAGVKLCGDHARAFPMHQYLDTLNDGLRLRDYVTQMLAARGLCAPDWKRAWAVPVLLDAPEYLEFERSQAGKPH